MAIEMSDKELRGIRTHEKERERERERSLARFRYKKKERSVAHSRTLEHSTFPQRERERDQKLTKSIEKEILANCAFKATFFALAPR